MGKSRGQIGDPFLKKYKRGTLATNEEITPNHRKAFTIFTRGVKLSEIMDALNNSGESVNQQQMFDIIRHVGRYVQDYYRKNINDHETPSKEKILFSEFVKGEPLQDLGMTYSLDNAMVIDTIRKVAKIYDYYILHNT